MSLSDVEEVTRQLSIATVGVSGVSFKGRGLKLDSEADCQELVDAIKECEDLHFLNLEGNTLGVDAAKAIAKALESKSELKQALWKDLFTGRMKTEIPKALLHLGGGLELAGANLSELDLSDNAFGPIGVQGLAGLLSSRACFTLQQLKLNNNGLGITGGKLLAQALLECYKSSSAAGKPLALQVFVAGRNRLENEGAEALSKVFQQLGSLEELAMPQNGIYHVGIAALSKALTKNPNLKVLNLNDNTVTAKGAACIAEVLPQLQRLRVLNLGDCLLRTKGAEVLATALAQGHCELEELVLDNNEIKAAGALAIAAAVTNKHKLKELVLNGNYIGNVGWGVLQESLEKSNRLSALGSLSEDDDLANEDENEEGESPSEESDVDSEDEEDEEDVETGRDACEAADVSGDAYGMIPLTVNQQQTMQQTMRMKLTQTTPMLDRLAEFLKNPSPENYTLVTSDDLDDYLRRTREGDAEEYIERFIPLLIKLSSVTGPDSKLCLDLYRELFTWALNNSQLIFVNNAIFVHLGFIKSEDKKFKINWNSTMSLSTLLSVIEKGIAPSSTRQILKCFVDTGLPRLPLPVIALT